MDDLSSRLRNAKLEESTLRDSLRSKDAADGPYLVENFSPSNELFDAEYVNSELRAALEAEQKGVGQSMANKVKVTTQNISNNANVTVNYESYLRQTLDVNGTVDEQGQSDGCTESDVDASSADEEDDQDPA